MYSCIGRSQVTTNFSIVPEGMCRAPRWLCCLAPFDPVEFIQNRLMSRLVCLEWKFSQISPVSWSFTHGLMGSVSEPTPDRTSVVVISQCILKGSHTSRHTPATNMKWVTAPTVTGQPTPAPPFHVNQANSGNDSDFHLAVLHSRTVTSIPRSDLWLRKQLPVAFPKARITTHEWDSSDKFSPEDNSSHLASNFLHQVRQSREQRLIVSGECSFRTHSLTRLPMDMPFFEICVRNLLHTQFLTRFPEQHATDYSYPDRPRDQYVSSIHRRGTDRFAYSR